MNGSETRKRLISAIAQLQMSRGTLKVSLTEASNIAGISRQAFNRYYGDLKPYTTGEKSIGELLGNSLEAEANRYTQFSHDRILELENKIRSMESQHQKELDAVTSNYTTTLMNQDILSAGADEIRTTLDQQQQLLVEYKQKISKLNMELASITAANKKVLNHNNNESQISFSPNLTPALKSYSKNPGKEGFELFLIEKENQIKSIIPMLAKYVDDTRFEFIIFIEQYISDFNLFVEQYSAPRKAVPIFIRLPLFSNTQIISFRRKLGSKCKISAFIPECRLLSERAAKRAFHFRNIPELEILSADELSPLKIQDGFNEITRIAVL